MMRFENVLLQASTSSFSVIQFEIFKSRLEFFKNLVTNPA